MLGAEHYGGVLCRRLNRDEVETVALVRLINCTRRNISIRNPGREATVHGRPTNRPPDLPAA